MAELAKTRKPADKTEPVPPRRISADQMAALFRSAAFGDVISVLMCAPKHRKLSLDALRTFLLPAIANNQFLIAKLRQQDKPGAVAAGVALWASVSDEVDRKLRANPGQPLKLTTEEWKSGPHLWLIDLVAPAALTASILDDLENKVARGRPMAAHIFTASNEAKITTLQELREALKKPVS